ncbi:MAG: adenylate/guanylate cyclase domain-containing protein, partial [Oscillospiraceae bacterium]|nr:adenylate/guanylate cyclase domain-containing protein [Oscillospiraceae bacterium]
TELNSYGQMAAYVLFIIILSIIYYIIRKYSLEAKKRREIVKVFGKYMEPKLVEQLAKGGGLDTELKGKRRDVSVLFVDIRGFTNMSESLEPEEVVEILNSYLGHVTGCVFKHHGMLDKFIGDAAMAIFNAPLDLEDYLYESVAAAWDIAEGAKALEEELISRFGKSIGFGIGVNCGPAVIGNIGCDFRMDYTAIGDTVNTASRLESNAKRGEILISSELYNRLKERITAESAGEMTFKGKSGTMEVFRVTGIRG